MIRGVVEAFNIASFQDSTLVGVELCVSFFDKIFSELIHLTLDIQDELIIIKYTIIVFIKQIK